SNGGLLYCKAEREKGGCDFHPPSGSDDGEQLADRLGKRVEAVATIYSTDGVCIRQAGSERTIWWATGLGNPAYFATTREMMRHPDRASRRAAPPAAVTFFVSLRSSSRRFFRPCNPSNPSSLILLPASDSFSRRFSSPRCLTKTSVRDWQPRRRSVSS